MVDYQLWSGLISCKWACWYLVEWLLYGWFGIMDYYFGSLFIVIVALATSFYVGWIMKIEDVKTEIDDGSALFSKPLAGNISIAIIWKFFIKYVCPVVIALVFLDMTGIFG